MKRYLLIVAVFFSLCACVSDGWKARPRVSPNELATQRTLSGVPIQADAWPTDTWWTVYGDPQLDTLIGEALADSPTLQIAEARLRAARAIATQASGARLPATIASAQVTRQRYSGNSLYPPPIGGSYLTDARIALDFSYDLDFWGRHRDVLASAEAGARAADADRAAARLALAVAVARAYFQLDLQYAFADVTRDNLTQQNAILDLTRQRAAAGLETTARVEQSEAMTALTRAAADSFEAGIAIARAQLAALVAAGPDRTLDLQRPHLAPPGKLALPGALPVDLLGRRPDIVAERWRVESAQRGVTAAKAAFYPNVNLVAFAGFESIGLSKLFEGSSSIAGAGPAAHLPLFNRRELRGGLEAQEAQYDLSVAQYNQVLIDAIRDVATAVANWDTLEAETHEAQAAQDAAQRAYAITRDRYRAGLDNYLTVLSSQNEVLLAQAVRAELFNLRLGLSTDLVRALGGGYLGVSPGS